MHLKAIEIISFRSINAEISVKLDPHMTVLVGANDHGKSNVLLAASMLDANRSVTPDDLYRGNKPAEPASSHRPRVDFVFQFEDSELRNLVNRLVNYRFNKSDSWTEEKEAEAKKALRTDPTIVDYLSVEPVRLYKTPLTKGFAVDVSLEKLPEPVRSFARWSLADIVKNSAPRTLYFDVAPALPDRITVEELSEASDPVLQGLLRLGGYYGNGAALVTDDNAGRRALKKFNRKFNTEFKKRYSQYKTVEWSLTLTNGGAELALEISDHAIDLGHPRERSLGFRSWLAFLLALYGETGEKSPVGCLILIDEPDAHLHPKGQKDMLAFLEELSTSNMVVFSTHSPFMVPRKFPQRVRQIIRQASGTIINENPYRDNWVSVVSDLGIAGPDMFRFADRYIVVEGVADSLLLTAMIAMAAKLGLETPNLDDIAMRWHDGATFVPHVCKAIDDTLSHVLAITDDDRAGQSAALKVRELARAKIRSVTWKDLGYPDGSSVEDLVPSSAVKDSLQELLGRTKDAWGLDSGQIERSLAAMEQRIEEHPRKKALCEVLVQENCISDVREFPSRQFANCAATVLASEKYVLQDRERLSLEAMCSQIKKLL